SSLENPFVSQKLPSGSDHRPIEIDIIQTIVGLINAVMDEVNLELLGFDLWLSRSLVLAIHTHVLMFLTILYYIEQLQDFQQQLETLQKQRPSLLNYFISMTVPDVSCDKDGGEIFDDQVLNTLRRVLTTKEHITISQIVQT
ncbi:unnamed protein product, partial [Didymodactylos carnosus]